MNKLTNDDTVFNDIEYEVIEDRKNPALGLFITFLEKTLRGARYDYYKKLKKQRELDFKQAELPYIYPEFLPTENIDIDFFTNDGLTRAWKTLTENQKRVLYLSSVLNFSISDISKILGITKSGVTKLINRATEKIMLFEADIFS